LCGLAFEKRERVREEDEEPGEIKRCLQLEGLDHERGREEDAG
jgi:hypothetical protein